MNRPPVTARPYSVRTTDLPDHLQHWELPPKWRWGTAGVWADQYRHSQEVIDGLGRSLCLVSAPEDADFEWLEQEARTVAHRSHPSVPTTYHYWTKTPNVPRGPGYLRRWVVGERVRELLDREGAGDLQYALGLVRAVGSVVGYLHSRNETHGAVGPDVLWMTATGRAWLLGWQWSLDPSLIPAGYTPIMPGDPLPPEWHGVWRPTAESDQWQLGATIWNVLTGEPVPAQAAGAVPPLHLVAPECPPSIASVIERMLAPSPDDRYPSVAAMLKDLDRITGVRTFVGGDLTSDGPEVATVPGDRRTLEDKLRWAVGEDYRILERIGAGQFGEVYRARDLTLQRDVAIKALHLEYADDPQVVSRFRQEARFAAQLGHPAIVPVYEWQTRGGIAWYTAELAEQGSLEHVVRQTGAMLLSEVAVRVDEVLAGLAAAHAAGITHRDIKPANILCDRWGKWRLADFGVAQALGARQTGTGTTGTPTFAAPEQLFGEEVGAPADCYAMAAITYYALTGVEPFPLKDPLALVGAQLREDVNYQGLPAPIVQWLRRGLASKPARRFADAGTMREAWWAAVEDALRDTAVQALQRDPTVSHVARRQRHEVVARLIAGASAAAEPGATAGPVAPAATAGRPAPAECCDVAQGDDVTTPTASVADRAPHPRNRAESGAIDLIDGPTGLHPDGPVVPDGAIVVQIGARPSRWRRVATGIHRFLAGSPRRPRPRAMEFAR